MRLEESVVEAMALGGVLLGCGGGGSITRGRLMGRLATEVGSPELISPDELDDDAVVVTASAVGAPAATEQFYRPVDFVRAVELLRERGGSADGIITSENGGMASFNGWFQAAILGIPVIDAPANGRAHPIGVMGSLGLHRDPGYISVQACAGGNPDTQRYLETVTTGDLMRCAQVIRTASIEAGGLVAVARNPVSCSFIKEHAAVGALSQAMELGGYLVDAETVGVERAVSQVVDALGGQLVARARVSETSLETVDGFDVGSVQLVESDVTDGAQPDEYIELTFWNEWMTVENVRKGGETRQRVATFPDFVALLDSRNGVPITSAEIQRGLTVALVIAPQANVKLGGGMRDIELYRRIERVLQKEIVPYVEVGH